MSGKIIVLKHLTARTIQGRAEIRSIVQAAKKTGLIHFHKCRKEANPPRHKLQVAL